MERLTKPGVDSNPYRCSDDGRNPTHLMGWKNQKENDYGKAD